MNEKIGPSITPLKYIKGFLVVAIDSTFLIGMLLYGFGLYIKGGEFNIRLVFQSAVFMGIATAVGFTIGKLAVSPTTKRMFLMFSIIVAIGILLLIVFALLYVRHM